MKKPRWKAVLKSKGYRRNKRWDYWKNTKNNNMIFEEEVRKDHLLRWIEFQEAPDCEYCGGSGWESTDGWHHGCTGCQGSGKDHD